MSDYDLVIRGGMVVDGSGGPARQADVGVVGGTIAEVAPRLGAGREEIDARGLVVTPGFVDVHTHYDGQATWDERLMPSSQHGVTTVVMGNCGVGFAPCRPGDHDALISLMEGVEDIPGTALAEGLPWDWGSFPDYLDALARRPRDIDVAALYPHGPLRVYVMGRRAIDREPASDADIVAMRELLAEGLKAGAVGFSTSRTMIHRTSVGDYTPMYRAAADELLQLGEALRAAPGSVFQMVSDFAEGEVDSEFDIIRRQCERTGCKGTFTLLRNQNFPDQWYEHLERIAVARRSGVDIQGQVLARPLGILMGFDASLNPYCARPTYRALADLARSQRVAELARPEVKRRILAEPDENPHVFMTHLANRFEQFYVMADPVDYLPAPEQSVAALARREGREPEEWLYDRLLEDDGRALAYVPVSNFVDNDPAPIAEMLQSDWTIPALGDGGAHVGSICDASAPTFLLTEWVRQRRALTIEHAVHLLSRRPTALFSLNDRGLLAPGMKADINVIDFDALALRRPHVVRDLPAGGRRFLQRAEGYRATVVAGEVTYCDGEATGRLPGGLIRRGRQASSTAKGYRGA